jgi:flavin reductase (DIM6/NTAB) family NADH-FMN oxidoreductase RutF
MFSVYPDQLSVQTFHHYLQGAIAPRPIALASTIDSNGLVNLSPFSFFNVFGTNPPTLIFSPNRRVRDNTTKHTLENVLEVPEVVINMVHYGMVEQVSLASCEYENGVNEFIKSGLTPVDSVKIRPPSVQESQAAFECIVQQVIQMGEMGGAANLVICEIVVAHFSEVILNENNMIDQRKTDWVARLGGDWYTRASGDALFEVPKPSTEKGIGIDQIPDYIKNYDGFNRNDLGRLANISQLPTPEEVKDFCQKLAIDINFETARQLLHQKKVKEAWLILLALDN